MRAFLGGLCLAIVLAGPAVVEGAEVSLVPAPAPACPGWQAKYFEDVRGYNAPAVVKRQEAEIDFDWGEGAPAPGMVADHFSAWWQCMAHFEAGTYRFRATSLSSTSGRTSRHDRLPARLFGRDRQWFGWRCTSVGVWRWPA